MYQQGAPEDDMRERVEEMERMRESMFREMDINRDGFIDYREFLQQTNTNDFKQDHGWQVMEKHFSMVCKILCFNFNRVWMNKLSHTMMKSSPNTLGDNTVLIRFPSMEHLHIRNKEFHHQATNK